MKTRQSLLCLCLLMQTLLYGQNQSLQEINTEWATKINHVFAHLDKSKVPNGILLDYGMQFLNLNGYQGTHIVDSNLVSMAAIEEGYKTILMSRIREENAGIIPMDSLSYHWSSARQLRTLPLTGLYFKYAEFKPNAEHNSVTITNNQLYDKYINGQWQNPYQEKHLFMMAPSENEYQGLAFQVTFPANLWLTNQASNIQKLEIDFDNGIGYQQINQNTTIPILYHTAGEKHWKYKLSLNNGEQLISHSSIKVRKSFSNFLNEPVNEGEMMRVTGIERDALGRPQTVFFEAEQGWNTLNLLPTRPRGIAQIDYIGNNTAITNPLIIAEGFDTGSITNPSALMGEHDIEYFQERKEGIISTHPLRLMTDTLSVNQQYDIIYVNNVDGTDHIQNNAYVLQEVIDWVNENKSTTNQNVVLGESMGGLVARYALKDMEDNGRNHDTRLYVSMDSPHQGANIPISFQYALKHVRRQYISTGIPYLGTQYAVKLLNFYFNAKWVNPHQVVNITDRPSVRQMLINHIEDNYSLNNSTHQAFLQEMQELGYPLQTRNIAISNGSMCGETQSFNPNDLLVSYDGQGNTRFLGDIIGMGLGPIAGVLTAKPQVLLGVLPGQNRFSIDLKARAHPNGIGGNEIYKNKISYTKKLLWVLPIKTNITNKSLPSIAGVLPYDYYGGGQYFLLRDVPDLISEAQDKNWFAKYNATAFAETWFSFIPTPSSLDIQATNNSEYLRSYGSTGTTTPFDNFITAVQNNGTSSNERHTFYTPRNGDWLAEELNGNTPIVDCSYACSTTDIQGVNPVCSTTNQYTVSNYNGAIHWSVSPSTKASINSNGLLTKLGNGEVTVTARITGACGIRTIDKTVWLGVPEFTINSTPNSNYVTVNIINNNYPIENQHVTNIDWEVIDRGGDCYGHMTAGSYGTYDRLFHGNCNNWWVEVKITVTNNCGSTTSIHTITPPITDDDPCSRTYSIRRVGKKVSVNRIIDNPCRTYNQKLAKEETPTIYAVNLFGMVVKRSKGYELDVSDLTPNVYIIKVQLKNKELYSKIHIE